ncbi:MAG: Chemotaxis protein [Acidimicrobiia bacterium]|nr:Chemotaxis protein [Acidimicrobiia bacterium]
MLSPRADRETATALPLDLAAVVRTAGSLEPLPASVTRLATLVAEEDSNLREIVEVVAFDQVLTGALLSRANSVVSAVRNPIRTVHEGVVRLGTGTVLALAMSASLSARMRGAIPEYGLEEGDLWRHSVLSALAVDALRRVSRITIPAEASSAALLHDVGKLVLARHLGPQSLRLIQAARVVDEMPQAEAESLLLEVDHGELGGLVAQHWGLPQAIVTGIAYHHRPEAVDVPIAYAVCLANMVAHAVSGEEVTETATRDSAFAGLAVSPTRWPSICELVNTRFAELSIRYM